MICKVCSYKTIEVFTKLMLGKYFVSYYQCSQCRFLQTEDPYWLGEAYGSGAISPLDTGIIGRNLLLRDKTKKIIHKIFDEFVEFRALDFGGGEGIFVRLMRDVGFNFYRHDLYADNLYARYFDVDDLPKGTRFDILTTFEVFEHLVDPMTEIQKMLTYSDIILFSTELQPSVNPKELEEWWYFVPETGQHVSFYHENTLRRIAEALNTNFYTDKQNLHVFSTKKLKINPFHEMPIRPTKNELISKVLNKIRRKFIKSQGRTNPSLESLTLKDFEYVRKKLSD